MSPPAGIRAELAVDGLDGCPVAAASDAADETLTGIRWTRAGGDAGVTERVELPSDTDTDSLSPPFEDAAVGDDLRRVVDGDAGSVAAFDRDPAGCACERIEALGCPVADVYADDGTLFVTVRVRDSDRLRAVVEAVGDRADRVRLTSVVRGDVRGGDGDAVVVDRDRLTDRQREVLATAYRRGFFEHPRACNVAELADELDVASSTVREHLARAQRRLLSEVFARECADGRTASADRGE